MSDLKGIGFRALNLDGILNHLSLRINTPFDLGVVSTHRPLRQCAEDWYARHTLQGNFRANLHHQDAPERAIGFLYAQRSIHYPKELEGETLPIENLQLTIGKSPIALPWIVRSYFFEAIGPNSLKTYCLFQDSEGIFVGKPLALPEEVCIQSGLTKYQE